MIIYGPFVHSVSLSEIEYVHRGLLRINDEDGTITHIESPVEPADVEKLVQSNGWGGEVLRRLRRGQFLSPGFIDTHTHAPQYPNNGIGSQYELLDWLDNVTFPGEAKFKDVDYARKIYKEVVSRTLSLGTTTSCYYGTLYLESTKALADICAELHQRAFVGKCNMDSNCPPEYIEPSASASIEETRSLITHIQSLSPSPADALVRPIITPRFAISCSPELLRGLGELAKEEDTRATKVGGYKMAIQTHMGENAGEIAFTKQLFKDAKAEKPWDGTYAGVYDRFGLLGERTILAHCVHLEEKELQLLQSTKSGISHCPISNFHLRSGCARIAEALDRGIKVGLGSDCGGGNEAGILPQIRAAMNTSKMVGMYLPASSNPGSISQQTHLSLSNTFHMATLGGAALCGLQDVIGNFKKGKQFDALLVDLTGKRGPGVWWTAGEEGEEGDASWLESGFERFIFTGDDRSISNVWVRGKLVGGTDA